MFDEKIRGFWDDRVDQGASDITELSNLPEKSKRAMRHMTLWKGSGAFTTSLELSLNQSYTWI